MDDTNNLEREKSESLRLKTLAEQKYNSNNLKSALRYAKRALNLQPDLDGISEMVTAFKILRVNKDQIQTTTTPHWYKILQVEPFSHINTIKKQYKKLALTLHPDKNSFIASDEAFKLVGEAFRVLSDKIRRKEYDMKLRIAMQDEGVERDCLGVVETFWTACSTCRLLHRFERKYLGHKLTCPSCKKSFEAVETGSDTIGDDDKGQMNTRVSARIRMRSELKRKMSSVGEILERCKSSKVESSLKVGNGIRNLRCGNNKEEKGCGIKVYERSKRGRVYMEEETMTLADMRKMLAERKANEEKSKLKLKDKEREKEDEVKEKGNKSEAKSGNSKTERRKESRIKNLEIMPVEDSDFYDFDKGRVERCFKKGQVWALYDDDDGMPRHYGLIDEVVSTHRFEVEMSWLDPQSNGDEGLICWEKMGFRISCGRFKISKKTTVETLNVFSHVMDCERAAREVYRIYPKKGSVWALYNKNTLDNEGRNPLVKDKRCYDIVVFLTSYSENHGLSMAYLEKVNGFKTVFKRREIGSHAIRWLEKDNIRSFSHQIPARRLSGEEAKDLSGDCWELDPASLPPELLTID